MSDKDGYHIGSGLAWLGFWLFLGMSCIAKNQAPEKLIDTASKIYTQEKEK